MPQHTVAEALQMRRKETQIRSLRLSTPQWLTIASVRELVDGAPSASRFRGRPDCISSSMLWILRGLRGDLRAQLAGDV